jgi:erythromycin esterase
MPSQERPASASRLRRFANWLTALSTLLLVSCLSEPLDLQRDYPVPDASTVWMDHHAVPLQHTEIAASLDELEPLRNIIGNARMVALGEATHGTREFFLTKARLVRFLVERMGFTGFAMEANWPEANRIDHYVRTGEGDLPTLLSGLYFWTWNTEEVTELIRWMRAYNAAGGNVGFYGVDMQYPGMAFDNVKKFLRFTSPATQDTFAARLSCLSPYVNGPDGRFPVGSYFDLPGGTRDACLADLGWIYDQLTRRRNAYEQATSPAAFERARHSARLLAQWEGMTARRGTRDAYMAENALWLLDQLQPSGRLVVWAHNGHVSGLQMRMGGYLLASLHSDYFNIGFSFRTGSFTAYRMNGSQNLGLGTQTVNELVVQSYPHYFGTSQYPQFLLDLRNRNSTSDSTAWLHGPREMRSIGAIFDPGAPLRYWYTTSLPAEFDAIIHFQNTTQSRVLPMQYPTSF